MNIPILAAVGILFLLLIVFLVKRNKKDRKEMEEQMNQDYHKTPDKEGETDTDEGKE